jgi:hypothetical protein
MNFLTSDTVCFHKTLPDRSIRVQNSFKYGSNVLSFTFSHCLS